MFTLEAYVNIVVMLNLHHSKIDFPCPKEKKNSNRIFLLCEHRYDYFMT